MGTRRPLVNNAIGNGLEADCQGLRIEKTEKILVECSENLNYRKLEEESQL